VILVMVPGARSRVVVVIVVMVLVKGSTVKGRVTTA
jgi:hypothetical protein